MREEQIRHLLRGLAVSTKKVTFTGSSKSGRWLTVACPFAPWTHAKGKDSNPSFGILVNDTSRSHYKCLACGVKGRLASLPSKLGGYRKKDYSKLRLWAELAEQETRKSVPLPAWDDVAVAIDYTDAAKPTQINGSVDDYPYALGNKYLADRGIGFLDIFRMGIRFDSYRNRVLFPVYDNSDQFCGFTGRAAENRKTWTKEHPKVRDYFGLPKRKVFLRLPSNRKGPRIIVEGLFDYARLVCFGYTNTHAILGTSPTPEKIDILLEEGEHVYFLLDNDKAGWQALFGIPDPSKDGEYNTADAWAFKLFREIPVSIIPYENDLDGLDPGSIRDPAIIKNMLDRAWLFNGKVPLNEYDEPTYRWRRMEKNV
jgi:hypothetical protein